MGSKIRWSRNATQDYQRVIEFLLTEWNEAVAMNFIDIVEYKIRQVSNHPHIGIISRHNADIRSVSLTKHNRMYYRIHDEETIEIANIFDTRRDPGKNQYE